MMLNMLLATLLCFVSQMSLVQAFHGEGSRCPCVGVSTTRVPFKKITKYTFFSEPVCSTPVVVFETVSKKRICSDPDTNWAKRVIQKIDEAQAVIESEQKELGSASYVTTAAVPTAPKKAPGRKGKGRKKGQRRRSGKERKGHRKSP